MILILQTNGLTEKMNKSIKDGLTKLREHKSDWPAHLNQVSMFNILRSPPIKAMFDTVK